MDEIISMIKFTAITLLLGAGMVLAVHGLMTLGSGSHTWNCIEPADGIGWAMFCEVGECNVLFYGDEFAMECGR